MQVGLANAFKCLTSKCIGWSFSSMKEIMEVDAYRQYWHPANLHGGALWSRASESAIGRVNVILLAESHVLTSISHFNVTFQNNAPINHPGNLHLPTYPQNFVRFIYNLGYGEDWLYNPGSVANNSRGTPQFWRLFSACSRHYLNNSFFTKKGTPHNQSRLTNKIQLVRELQERGIWLLDASVSGKPMKLGTSVPISGSQYNQFIACSWCNTTRLRVQQEKPYHVIIIGHQLARALRTIKCGSGCQPDLNIPSPVGLIQHGTLMGINATIVPQPQARLNVSKTKQVLDKIHHICAPY